MPFFCPKVSQNSELVYIELSTDEWVKLLPYAAKGKRSSRALAF